MSDRNANRSNWSEWLDQTLELPSILWDRFGLMLAARAASLFSLPIEGSFWVSVMGDNHAFFANALPFTLDLIADLIVYRYGRIQQSAAKGTKKSKLSRYILVFVAFNAAASWGAAAWQLYNVMQPVHIVFPILFALIQPVMGAGVAYTQAVQDGKYDDDVVKRVEKPTPQPEHKVNKGMPDVEWWRNTYPHLNGEREQMTPERVRELIQAEWESVPSPTTLYNWAKEAAASLNTGEAG